MGTQLYFAGTISSIFYLYLRFKYICSSGTEFQFSDNYILFENLLGRLYDFRLHNKKNELKEGILGVVQLRPYGKMADFSHVNKPTK